MPCILAMSFAPQGRSAVKCLLWMICMGVVESQLSGDSIIHTWYVLGIGCFDADRSICWLVFSMLWFY